MNCANHPQNPVAAYCRTCGKPLCTSCTRQVMGVVYCENCLAERVAGGAPSQPSPYTGPAPVTPVGSGPNPALAGILAGFFPFGVGAVYCGQYARGLAHFVIFVLLIVGQANVDGGTAHMILGLCIAGFYFYQLIDAIKTAKALQLGQTPPDPFGLGTMFSPGDRRDMVKGAPVGAVVLIGLGFLFLLENTDYWYLSFNTLWPVILIALGMWLFAKRKTAADRGDYRHRSMVGPAVLVTLGVLFLLDKVHEHWYQVPGWNHTWPVILLVIGVLKLLDRGYLGNDSDVPPPTPPTSTPQPPNEVKSEVNNG